MKFNDESTTIDGFSMDEQGWKTGFDVIVKTGQQYCLAITCQGESPGHSNWNPWDVGGQRRLWYRLDVDENAGHLLVEITRNLDPGQALTATEVDDLAGFDPSRRPTIESGCRR